MSECVTIGDATLYHGDCIDVLSAVVRADAIITDPPYEAEAHTLQRRVLGRGITACRDILNQALPFIALTDRERRGVCRWAGTRLNGWFLAFCQTEAVGTWRDSMVGSGARWRRAGIWDKPDGSPQLSGDRPAAGHESIAMAWYGPGRSVWSGGGSRGVFRFGVSDDGTGHGGAPKLHPTQKPRLLMERLVSLFTVRNEIVIDPFMGAASTGIACVVMGRRFVGIEKDRVYFEIACERIDNAQRQFRMFA